MSDEPVELRDTFDGYLMFDFSNFHGLMAQSFDSDDIDVPKVDKPQKKKGTNVPGPYLDTPPVECERDGDGSDGILFNGEMGEDNIPEINLEEDSHFNYSQSGFNLLANLDFEPDEDAYENAINLSDPSTQNIQKSTRTKRISIFSPTLHFEDNQDQKIQMINIQNIELLKEDYNLDEFYKFLRQLDFLNYSNTKLAEDQTKVDQLINLVHIRISFEKMSENLQKKNHLSHLISYQSKLHFFQQQLDHFINLVNYIVEHGVMRQKLQRDQIITNAKKDHTLTMSVAFFKGLEIMEQYKFLMCFKQNTEHSRRVEKCRRCLHSLCMLLKLLTKCKAEFTNRKQESRYSHQYSSSSTLFQGYTCNLEMVGNNNGFLYKTIQSLQKQQTIKGIDAYYSQPRFNPNKFAFRTIKQFRKPNYQQYLVFDDTNNQEVIYYVEPEVPKY